MLTWQGLESFTLVFSPTDGTKVAIQAPNGYFLQTTSGGDLIANVASWLIIGVASLQWGASAFTISNVSAWGHWWRGVNIWKSGRLEAVDPSPLKISSAIKLSDLCFRYHALFAFHVSFLSLGDDEGGQVLTCSGRPQTIRLYSLFQSSMTKL